MTYKPFTRDQFTSDATYDAAKRGETVYLSKHPPELHSFTDDGSDPGNCSVCHFFHTDKRGPNGEHAPQCDSETRNHACVRDAGHDGKHFDNGVMWGADTEQD